MEKILSFFTSKPVALTESEGFFKKYFRLFFAFAAGVVAVYAIYSIVSVAIDYFKFVFDLEAFQIIRHLILFIFSLIIAVLTYIFVIGAFFQRSKMILSDPNPNLIDIMPGVLRTFGIIAAIIPISIGIVGFLSALLAAVPFFPMEELTGIIAGLTFMDMPSLLSGFGVDGFQDYIKQLFGTGLVLLILSIFAGFINLVAMYLIAAVYKLFVDFLRK